MKIGIVACSIMRRELEQIVKDDPQEHQSAVKVVDPVVVSNVRFDFPRIDR